MRARPLALIATALLCWNFFAFIYPNPRVENNEPLAFALRQQKNWPARMPSMPSSPRTGLVIRGAWLPGDALMKLVRWE